MFLGFGPNLRTRSDAGPWFHSREFQVKQQSSWLRQGEGIVCASGNGGFTRSSDLHEWRNDLGTVSSRDPVKL